MSTSRFRCRHCRRLKARRTRAQQYCGEESCQQARKNRWRRQRYATDPDYRANQRDCNDAWLARQGGSASYHRAYRLRRHDAQERSAKDSAAVAANSDANPPISDLTSGLYRLIALGDAKRDTFVVNLRIITDRYGDFTSIDALDEHPADDLDGGHDLRGSTGEA